MRAGLTIAKSSFGILNQTGPRTASTFHDGALIVRANCAMKGAILAIILALSAALFGGAADFAGGTAARRTSAREIVSLSQASSLVFCILLVATTGGVHFSDMRAVLWGIPAGLCMSAALVLLYSALAMGTMGVIAPIGAAGVLIPVVWSLALGIMPSILQLSGIGVALVGIILASGADLSHPQGKKPIAFAAASAIGSGFGILFLSQAAKNEPLNAILVIKLTIVLSIMGFSIRGIGRRPSFADGAIMVFIGATDFSALSALAYASHEGPLSIVAVLASLYPVITVLLARSIHGERLTTGQKFGVLCAIFGIGFIGLG